MQRLFSFCVVVSSVAVFGGCLKESKRYQAVECVKGDAAKPCPTGSTCLEDNQCHEICQANTDCSTGMVCGNGGLCEAAPTATPTIASVDGDGSANGASDHAAHFTNAGLIINGTGFTGAVVALGSGGSYQNLVIRSGATAERMEVDLPSGIAQGNYALVVANALGSTEVVLPLIKGEKGDTGVCSAAACTSKTLPGSGVVSTVVARGVNGTASTDISVLVDGNELIDTPTDGIWLGLLNRGTHQAVQSAIANQTYGADAAATLVANLASIAEDQIAIIASRGNVSAMMSALSPQLKRLGASDTVRGLSANEAFVVVGYPGIGEGNAALVISSTTVAEATVLLVDGQIVGPHTGTALGRSIGTAEIENGAVTAEKLAAGAVGSNQIADRSIGAGDIASGVITANEVAFAFATGTGRGGAAIDVACSGCVQASDIAPGAITANEMGVTYAAGTSRGGAAIDVACSGCVSGGDIAADSVPFNRLVQAEQEALACEARNTTNTCSTTSAHTLCVFSATRITGDGMCNLDKLSNSTWQLQAIGYGASGYAGCWIRCY